MGCDTPILCPLLPTSPRKQGPYHPGGVGASEHCTGRGRLGWQRTPSGTGQVTNRRLSRWTPALRVRAEESGPALFSLDLGAFAVTRLPYATEGVACALAWDSHSHADPPLRVTRVTKSGQVLPGGRQHLRQRQNRGALLLDWKGLAVSTPVLLGALCQPALGGGPFQNEPCGNVLVPPAPARDHRGPCSLYLECPSWHPGLLHKGPDWHSGRERERAAGGRLRGRAGPPGTSKPGWGVSDHRASRRWRWEACAVLAPDR